MRNIELRGFSNAPATFMLTEKEAGIGFRIIGGKVDYAGFMGKDPVFRDWVKDLFDYYWDEARKA
jgi:predicted transcriptional regulator